MVSPQLRRQAVVVMRSEVAVSERRACGLMQIYRRTYRYVPRPEDPRLRVRLRELAAERRRFGYRRLTRMLLREGWKANHKRVYRLFVGSGADADAPDRAWCYRRARRSPIICGRWTSPAMRLPTGASSGH
jgi:transposase InsO family protein